MTTFNRETAKKLRLMLVEAVKPIEKELNCSFNLDRARITFTTNEIRFKLVATAEGNPVEITLGTDNQMLQNSGGRAAGQLTPDENLWFKHCHKFGLLPDHIGRQTVVHGSRVTIVGIKPKAKKNCVIIRGVKGGRYICSAAEAISGLV